VSDLDCNQENNVVCIESLFNLTQILIYPKLIRIAIHSTHKSFTRHQMRNLMCDRDVGILKRETGRKKLIIS